MSKSDWRGLRYLLVAAGAFVAGYCVEGWLNSKPQAVHTADPKDCTARGLKPTGWEFQALYKGGINNGGASSMITYECK